MRRFESREARFSSRTLQQYAAFGLPEKLAIRAATESAPAELMIYDEIGFWGVSAEDVVAALATIGDGPLTVRINSPGGSAFDGIAIYNALRARTAPVTTQVDGIAASAASFIAMAGQTVTMSETALLMIHNCFTLALGNKNDLREEANIMDKIDGQMAAIYAAKTGKSVDDVRAMLDAETWLTGTEAKAQGFCDALVNPVSSDDGEEVNAKARADRKAAAKAAPRAEAAEPAVTEPTAVEPAVEPAETSTEAATEAAETTPAPDADPERTARLRRAQARLRLADVA